MMPSAKTRVLLGKLYDMWKIDFHCLGFPRVPGFCFLQTRHLLTSTPAPTVTLAGLTMHPNLMVDDDDGG